VRVEDRARTRRHQGPLPQRARMSSSATLRSSCISCNCRAAGSTIRSANCNRRTANRRGIPEPLRRSRPPGGRDTKPNDGRTKARQNSQTAEARTQAQTPEDFQTAQAPTQASASELGMVFPEFRGDCSGRDRAHKRQSLGMSGAIRGTAILRSWPSDCGRRLSFFTARACSVLNSPRRLTRSLENGWIRGPRLCLIISEHPHAPASFAPAPTGNPRSEP
jgi:hypothetical protein